MTWLDDQSASVTRSTMCGVAATQSSHTRGNHRKRTDSRQIRRIPARRVIKLTVPGATAVYPATSGAMERR